MILVSRVTTLPQTSGVSRVSKIWGDIAVARATTLPQTSGVSWVSEMWGDIGFHGNDPATDFRGKLGVRNVGRYWFPGQRPCHRLQG